MSAPYHYIQTKAEAAIVAWLETKSIGTGNIWSARRAGLKTGQNVTVFCRTAKETPRGSGNYSCAIELMVRSPIGDTDETMALHDTLLANTIDAFKGGGQIWSEINLAYGGDFTAFQQNQMNLPIDISSGVQADYWVDQFNFTLYCAPSIIS